MLEGESLSFADRKFRVTFPKQKVGRAYPLLGYVRPLCLLPVAVGFLGSVGHPLLFIAQTSSERLKPLRPKVCRKVCVAVLFSEDSDAIKARFPACLPLSRQPCPGGALWRGSSIMGHPVPAPWPCPQPGFRSYRCRRVWTICIELVWELFAALPPLFGFVCWGFFFGDGSCAEGVFCVLQSLVLWLLVSCVFPALGLRRWERPHSSVLLAAPGSGVVYFSS